MKKRILSLFLVMIMLFQAMPVFAAGTLQISNDEDFFKLNDDLGVNAIINNDIHITIDDDYLTKYGAQYIGSETEPFTGTIEGNNHTIYLDVNTDVDTYALFYYLKGAQIKNLKVVYEDFYTSADEEVLNVSAWAHIVEDSYLSVGTNFVLPNRNVICEESVQNNIKEVNIAAIAYEARGHNDIYASSMFLDLYAVPDTRLVRSGAVIYIPEGNVNQHQSTLVSVGEAFIRAYAKLNSFVIGGAVAEVGQGSDLYTRGTWMVDVVERTGYNVAGTNGTVTGNIGGIVGKNYGYVSSSGKGQTYMDTLGYFNHLNAASIVALNLGTMDIHSITTLINLMDDDGVVSYKKTTGYKDDYVYIGGLAGHNAGYVRAHSNGINLGFDKIEAPNAVIKTGNMIGYNDNGNVVLANNGTSFKSPKITGATGSKYGFMIGETTTLGNVNILYNIINATDENAFKTDYNWVNGPVGNLNNNQSINKFLNNYWGYMDYAELNKPTQIYFMSPMNYYGDTPAEMRDSDFPFLARYSYLVESEDNQYLTFQNPTKRGIGTVLLTKDCVAAVSIGLKIVEDSPEYDSVWHSHSYRNWDVLNHNGVEEPEEGGNGGNNNPGDGGDDNQNPGGDDDNTNPPDDGWYENGNYCRWVYDTDGLVHKVCYGVGDNTGGNTGNTGGNGGNGNTGGSGNGNNDWDEDDWWYEEYEKEEETKKGIPQAVVSKGIYQGTPLPTFNTSKKSEVKLNYYELPYKIITRDKTFKDIKNHKYEDEILEGANRMIIEGYTDGTFGPDRNITRAEFSTMIVRALGLLPVKDMAFTDVPEGKWYTETVNTAASWGIVVGVGNNMFAPEKNITRQEAAIMLIRAAELVIEKEGFTANYGDAENLMINDTNKISNWAYKEVMDSLMHGLVAPRGKNFEPLQPITRAETAASILNLLKNYEVIDK